METRVNPKDIERELTRIWRATAAEDREHDLAGGEPRVRAILSNLIVITDRNRVRIDALVNRICVSYPSRLFLIELHTDPGDPVETFVSSRCVIADSGAHVCSEEVHLKVRPAGLSAVANLLTSLFVADVERIVLLPGDWVGSGELLGRIRSVADRVVYDSAHFSSCVEGFRAMHDLAEGRAFLDVSWLRGEPWRVLAAELFDRPLLQEALDSLQVVEIVVGTPAVYGEMALFTGWVAESLKLELVEGRAGGEVHFRDSGGSQHVRMRIQRSAQGQDVNEVRFQIDDSRARGHVGQLECILRRVGERGEVSLHSSRPGEFISRDGTARSIPFRQRSGDELLLAGVLAHEELFLGAFRRGLEIVSYLES